MRQRHAGLKALTAPALIVVLSLTVLCGCTGTRSGSGSTPTVTWTAAPTGVVSSTAPTDPAQYDPCYGIPSSALKNMFGDKASIVSEIGSKAMRGTRCQVLVDGRYVYESQFWFITSYHGAWDDSFIAHGSNRWSFSFDEAGGSGRAEIDEGLNPKVGTMVYTCGENYLTMVVKDASVMDGNMKDNLTALTRSATPWLCQGQPIPGLDRTMDQVHQTFSVDGSFPSPRQTTS